MSTDDDSYNSHRFDVRATITPMDRLLDGLSGIRHQGDRQWLARCPAHQDKSPSLSIREQSDGTVLLHCFAGCSAAEVVEAAGLQIRDLFPPRPEDRASLRPGQRHLPRSVLAAISHEVLIALVAAEMTAKGEALSKADLDRLAKAAAVIRDAAREVGHDV